MKRYIGLTLLFLFTVMCTNSFAVQITVGSGSAQPSKSVSLPITVDTPGGIAGAAFTLTYDTTKLTLTSITSSFFDTFANQWIGTPNPSAPTLIVVNGVTYTQPLLRNPVSGGMAIAAARCKAGAVGTTLFTVSFTVGEYVAAGQLPVTITPTILNNVTAGYSLTGEAIPILIGAVDGETNLSLAYPVLPSTTFAGSVTVLPPPDVNGNGIDDNWELKYFGNLTTATATSDYDKDGYSDLQEYLNSKNGLKDPNGNPYDPTVKNAGGPRPVRVDFNGDGKPDIFWRYTSTGENYVWFMDGATMTGWTQLPTLPGKDWIVAGVADFDGNGKPDIFWRNTSTGENYVWFMDGATMTGWEQLPTVSGQDWIVAGVADFDGNGKPDIFWRYTPSGENYVWFMDGATMTGWEQLPTLPGQDWIVAGVADFDGNGKPDIFWRYTPSGENYVWFMDGATVTGWEQLPTLPGQDWIVAAVDDFDGNGKPDIFWRYTPSGENYVWFMDGSTITGWVQLPTLSGQNWIVENH